MRDSNYKWEIETHVQTKMKHDQKRKLQLKLNSRKRFLLMIVGWKIGNCRIKHFQIEHDFWFTAPCPTFYAQDIL